MAVRNLRVMPAPGKSRGPALTIAHPNAAGIDIGSASHFVAVPPDRDDEPVLASVEEIAASLQGTWRAEHLFALKQALAAFDFVGTQLAECDREIELQLRRLKVHDGDPAKGKKRGRARNAPKFDLRTQLFQMCGVDLTRIDGIDVTTALAVVSEIGVDMSRFPTIKHFISWLGV